MPGARRLNKDLHIALATGTTLFETLFPVGVHKWFGAALSSTMFVLMGWSARAR